MNTSDYPWGFPLEASRAASLTELFQQLNRAIPESQELEVLPSHTAVKDALTIMKRKGYSQVPISAGAEVIGVFSFRSFSLGALQFLDHKTNALSLTVADFVETVPFRSVHDAFECAIPDLDRMDAVLVGTSDNLKGIVTAMDVLRYLYGVTSPFVLLAEIEYAIRALMRSSAQPAELQTCFRRSLAKLYPEENLPSTLESLAFRDYASVIGYGDNWEQHFQLPFGGTRTHVRTKLEMLGEIRNQVFHFRREITEEELGELTEAREWLLRRCKIMRNKQPNTRLEVA